MNRNLISARLLSDQAKIIEMYKSGVDILELADEYNIMVNTLCQKLRKWGIKIRSGDWWKESKKYKQLKQKFSPELLARMKENSRINNNPKKGIQYVKFVRTTADQYLISNITNHPIIG